MVILHAFVVDRAVRWGKMPGWYRIVALSSSVNRQKADPIEVVNQDSKRCGRQACRQIRGGLEDVNGTNCAIVLPFYGNFWTFGKVPLETELDHFMTNSNESGLPKIILGFAIGIATGAIAVGAYFIYLQEPAKVAVIGTEIDGGTEVIGATEVVEAPQVADEPAEASAASGEDPEDSLGLGQVYARIDGEPITAGDLAVLAQDYAQELGRVPPEQRASQLLSGIIEMRVLANAAVKDGLDEEDMVLRRIALARSRILSDEFLRQAVAEATSEERIRARFDEELAEFEADDELHLFHILVESEEEARAIVADIEQGADFASIAAEKSKDPGSGANGGDLDFVPRGMTVPEFEKAAFALEIGEYTKEPVQTQFGWHVIRLEEKRKTTPPEFVAAEARIRTDLIRETVAEKVESLRVAAKVEIVPPPEAAADEADAPAANGAASPADSDVGAPAQ
jgi:peptidyl-prolyl cis-trans isomerase C